MSDEKPPSNDVWSVLVVAGFGVLWLYAAWTVLSSPAGQRTMLWLLAAMAAIVAGGAAYGLWLRLVDLWRREVVHRGATIVARYGAVLGGLWLGSWLVAAIIGAPTWAVFLAAAVVLSVRAR